MTEPPEPGVGQTVAVIHATPLSMPPVDEAFQEIAPQLRRRHLLDDSLLPAIEAAGGLDGPTRARLTRLVDHALADPGTDAVLLACSSYAAAVPALKDREVPVLAPDEAMLERAVDMGPGTIGLLVTVEPAVEPAVAAMEQRAATAGVAIEIVSRCVPEAMAALRDGDRAAFVAALQDGARRLVEDGAQRVLLGQFSMAPARAEVGQVVDVPVLSSPHAAAQMLAQRLAP